MKRITQYKLSVEWEDGKTEGLSLALPEYLHLQLRDYFNELEWLRAEKRYRFEPLDVRHINEGESK